MQNKKAVGFGVIVTVLALLGTFFIILIIVTKGLTLEKRTGEESVCSLSAWANCLGHEATFGVESFKLKCPAELKTITMEDLKAEAEAAKKRMEALAIQFKYLIGKNTYVPRKEDLTDDLAYEFVMNKIIAKDLKKCWGHFKGVPCLFSRWWLPWGCRENDEDCQKGSILSKIKPKMPPNYCVICTRYKFDKAVQKWHQEFRKGKAIMLSDWLKVNEVPLTEISYAEYLKDDDPSGVEKFRSAYNPQKEYWAVVFGKANEQYINRIVTWGWERLSGYELTKDYITINIYAYDNVDDNCVYIEG